MGEFRAPLVAVIVLVVAVFACGGGGDGGAEPVEATPTLVLDPTARPEATDAPDPTDVPESTATPKAEKAPSGPPAEVQAYALEVAQKSVYLRDGLTAIGGLLIEPKLDDEEWMLQVATQAALIQVTHQELAAMDVPAEMAEFHEALKNWRGGIK